MPGARGSGLVEQSPEVVAEDLADLVHFEPAVLQPPRAVDAEGALVPEARDGNMVRVVEVEGPRGGAAGRPTSGNFSVPSPHGAVRLHTTFHVLKVELRLTSGTDTPARVELADVIQAVGVGHRHRGLPV